MASFAVYVIICAVTSLVGAIPVNRSVESMVTVGSEANIALSQPLESVLDPSQSLKSVPDVPQSLESVPDVPQSLESVPDVPQSLESVPGSSQALESVPRSSSISPPIRRHPGENQTQDVADYAWNKANSIDEITKNVSKMTSDELRKFFKSLNQNRQILYNKLNTTKWPVVQNGIKLNNMCCPI